MVTKSRRTHVACALIASSSIFVPPGQSGTYNTPDGNPYVQLHVRVSKTILHPGEEGLIEATFSPADDIHINADPAVTIAFPTTSDFTFEEETSQTVDTETGYLSVRTPVTASFTTSCKAQPGTYALTGKVVYYYCSESENWCRRQVQPITLTITVVE